MTSPGPGSEAWAFTTPLAVAGMQKIELRVPLAGTPGVSGPGEEPFAKMLRQVGCRKQPAWGWLGPQNLPAASAVAVLLPLVSGVRETVSGPMCRLPSAHTPPPTVHGLVALTPPGRQSRVKPVELVDVHASPPRTPRSQVPVAGLLGVPAAGTFGAVTQRGQGVGADAVIENV